MKTSDIQIRDPYIYTDKVEKTYHMFGTTDHDCWHGPGQGFDCYSSKDLTNWDGPFPAFRGRYVIRVILGHIALGSRS